MHLIPENLGPKVNHRFLNSDLRPYFLDTWVNRGAELSADHHSVVSWIRCTEHWPDLPGKARRAFQVVWEHLGEI